MALGTTEARSTGSFRRSSRPPLMRETSSRSSTRRIRRASWMVQHLVDAVGWFARAGLAENMQRVAYRRERIAQLGRQGRKEFVLAAVGPAERLLRLHPVGDGDGDSAQQPGPSGP